jgi:hypothetical protein
LISKAKFYYERFQDIVIEYSRIIETTRNINGTLVYNHSNHTSPPTLADIVIATRQNLTTNIPAVEYIEPRNNAIDIANIMRSIAIPFFENAGMIARPNPYNPDPLGDPLERNKYLLYENAQNKFDKVSEREKFLTLFDWLYIDRGEPSTSTDGPQELYKFVLQIDVLYNGFALENDVYNFMGDYVIQNSTLKDLPGLQGSRVETTHANILAYYQQKQLDNLTLQNRITGEDGSISLFTILQRSLNAGLPAKFAWIRRIGHYLLDQIWIKIDDQIIDKHYGEWLEIWHSLTKRISKERGYNALIGNISDLYTFDNKVKGKYEMLIPLQFWFNRYIGCSLPMISLHNADIRLYVKLKEFSDVCYYDTFTLFRKKPRLECSILAEYIYVEDDERHKMATSKLEYIIDTLQYNGDMVITKESLTEEMTIDALMRFKNPCKELVWAMQNIANINGTLPFGERRWDDYSYNYTVNGVTKSINPIGQARIKFNRRDREIYKDAIYYNYIQSNERHYSDPSLGVNCYIFALNPESHQPTGAANMSKIDDTSIEMTLKQVVIDQLNTTNLGVTNLTFRVPIYCLGINVIRIFSGLGGLVFFQ